MAGLGSFCLLLALCVSTYSMCASVVGARRRWPRLAESGRQAAFAVCAILTLASAAMVHAFVSDDFRVKYVHHYSDSTQPFLYKLTAYWGGLDGSLLFWAWLLSLFAAIALHTNRHRQRALLPYVTATLAGVTQFFLVLLIFSKNPFDLFLTAIPPAGRGLNPLLQNFYMIFHPPSLYVGFVGMTIPFAFCLAALITGHLDDAWLHSVRRWMVFSWLLLTIGLLLGMLWAYEELGWGGYWAWDPVENAGLIPWLTATAYLHSQMVQERRGMLKVWNVSLLLLTFLLTILATFMTRSGVVQSVHAFGQDNQLAWLFGIFMLSVLLFCSALIVYRLPQLRSRSTLESVLSREFAFLLNDWILLGAAFFVLVATLFPTLSEAVAHTRVTVGPQFYNQWMIPIGVVLLFLKGFGPLVAWRKATPRNLWQQFRWPVLTAALVTLLLALLLPATRALTPFLSPRLLLPVPLFCFALVAYVVATIMQEFWRGAGVRARTIGVDRLTALIGLTLRGRRRYGGYVIHLGVALMFIGFAGDAWKSESVGSLHKGETLSLGEYSVRAEELRRRDDPAEHPELAHMQVARLTVLRGGKPVGSLSPARWFYRKWEEQPETRVSIRRTVGYDLYLILAGLDEDSGLAHIKMVRNPLVNWIWIGFVFLLAGAALALSPEGLLAGARARLPAAAEERA